MNKRRISWLLAAVAMPALVFGAMALTAFAEPGFDLSKADNLAHIAVLDDSVVDVLGGGNWSTTSDEWTDSEPPKTAACDSTFAKMKTLEKSLTSQRVARAKNVMEQPPSDGEFPKVVESEVVVFKTAAPAEQMLKELKAVYATDAMTTCLATLLDSVISGTTGQKATAYIPTAADDPAAAYAGEFKASQVVSPIRIEHYTFVEGNVLTQVTIYGPKPAVTKENVEFLMDIQVASIQLLSGY